MSPTTPFVRCAGSQTIATKLSFSFESQLIVTYTGLQRSVMAARVVLLLRVPAHGDELTAWIISHALRAACQPSTNTTGIIIVMLNVTNGFRLHGEAVRGIQSKVNANKDCDHEDVM